MQKNRIAAAALLLTTLLPAAAQDLHVVTTGDVHGSYFNRPYVGNKMRPSLMSVKHYVDSLRSVAGEENVILIDAGDCLQGDNASYYYNYVATEEPHIYPRIAAYMGYDVCVLGNHDIETGHPVYDRVNRQLGEAGISWLAGNAFKEDGSTYFPEYVVLEKGGRRVLVLGYNNANIDGWLSPDLWSGMTHASLVPLAAARAEALRKSLHPDAVIVVVHSGTGDGDGRSIESQGLDIFMELTGADLLVTAHDHRPVSIVEEGKCLVNGGARSGGVGHAVLSFDGDAHVASRSAEVVRMDKFLVDEAMVQHFDGEFQAVKEFTNRPVGRLDVPLRSRDAYSGMSDYVNLLHTVQLAASGADISIAAPLSYDGSVAPGQLVFNDMFTIYPFENQLFVLKMKGREIKDMLEFSYDRWIQTPGDHVLAITNSPDPRTGAPKWSFVNRSYNFDSAAGINYTVDVTKDFGSRVSIASMADSSPFDPDAEYTVAMTSYRANGGGALLTEGAGIPHGELGARIVGRYAEIRDFVYKFFTETDAVDSALLNDYSVLGKWEFVPESVVAPLMESDMRLVF